MSRLAGTVVVIRVVRVGGSPASPVERGVVATMCDGRLDTDGHVSYLIVPSERPLATQDAARRTVADIRVGDVVAWIGEPYAALWVADQTPGAPRSEPRSE